MIAQLTQLGDQLAGELHLDETTRRAYATDASAYQELPVGVAIPKTVDDLVAILTFAGAHQVGIIPRTAGTSLAGQVVGSGLIVDLSVHFTRILEINAEAGWVRVQPGVIRSELNRALAPHGLFFPPETATQNRAMVGGMVGNNSCGANSVRYGSTRDHLLRLEALLADATPITFEALTDEAFADKCDQGENPESRLYRGIRDLLAAPEAQQEILDGFPDPQIKRRNTGYALDLLLDASPLRSSASSPFNFCKLVAGSEGTLCLVTEMTLNCEPLPPPIALLHCAHFKQLDQALQATRLAVAAAPYACELIDHHILAGTARSLEHRHNRFFVEGEPAAILITELRADDLPTAEAAAAALTTAMRDDKLGYAFPTVTGDRVERVWELRRAGLGMLSNIPGDAKPAPVVEDTAVAVADLPTYIAEFDAALARLGLSCVHYAHAGAGEIHLRPILNLKTTAGQQQFRQVAELIFPLVKKYRGSLSGEHGDGRLRAEFIRAMVGDANYQRLRAVKKLFDPDNILNPGKITDAPPMDVNLRYLADAPDPKLKTVFDWTATQGIVRAAEMCNGSGDCRKLQTTGGTMCPSYQATRDERHTTRARANLLRQLLSRPEAANPYDHEALREILDLCLSCKGCKKECPSTVDMAKLKAECQQAWHDLEPPDRRTRLIADFAANQRRARRFRPLHNAAVGIAPLRRLLNRLIGFHPERSIPQLPKLTLQQWFCRHQPHPNAGSRGRVWFLNDEFTNYLDLAAGSAAVELLEQLGYRVDLAPVGESGRTWLSKGFLRHAKALLNDTVPPLAEVVSAQRPLIGIEPSALLTFRDEALDLIDEQHRQAAVELAPNCLLLEEFIAREAKAGSVSATDFHQESRTIHLHGHCFQKALAGIGSAVYALSLPPNYRVEVIPSGCCGMAGAFGYESEHYDLSMQIGEMVLFPAVRKVDAENAICASGTSCRHQLLDGTGRIALHPAQILRSALIPSH